MESEMLRMLCFFALAILATPFSAYAVEYTTFYASDSGDVQRTYNVGQAGVYTGWSVSSKHNTTKGLESSYYKNGAVIERKVVNEFDISNIAGYDQYFLNITSTTNALTGADKFQINYYEGNLTVDESDFYAGQRLGSFHYEELKGYHTADIYGTKGDFYIDITDLVLNSGFTNLGFTFSILDPEGSSTTIGRFFRESYILGATRQVATALPMTSPAPLPGAVWLLGSGLLSVIGIRRRKSKSTR